ncbi:MAG TPA: hydrogenase iron-sulfur subunit [Methanomassiliicoccales archaeon]|nr:hydrogenase iron-sulfur subunit [Methanomassiliicoccales archaeon]
MEKDWTPRIVAFCCNWCAYAGADLAGVNRKQCKPDFRVVRVMCSGRVSPGIILHAFESGFDGVMVLGCHIGDCHYRVGNLNAEKQVAQARELITLAGVEPERLLLRWISAAEGDLFATTVDEFTDTIIGLGPLGGGRPGD